MPTSAASSNTAGGGDRKTSGLKRHARERNRDSLHSIRTAAKAVFVRSGYSAVTMEELAREAGVTRQTIYRHFPSKYEVALDFMKTAQEATLAVWSQLDAHDLTERQSVFAWVRSVITHNIERTEIRAYVELTSTEPAYRRVLADLITQIIKSLADVHPVFETAARDPDGLDAAKMHLFVATLMERSDFIAIGEEWFAQRHLEQIMTDWLMALTEESG